MSFKPMQDYYPPLKERGMIELVGAKRASCVLWYLIATPNPAAASAALVFTDAEGNPAPMADTDYVVIAQSEGQAATVVDESTKTVLGCSIVAGGNFTNPINVMVMGRTEKQPRTQL